MGRAQDILRRIAAGHRPESHPVLDHAVKLYKVEREKLELLLDESAPGGLAVRPTRPIGSAQTGAQASTLGTNLVWKPFDADAIERLCHRASESGDHRALLPTIRYWSAALAVSAWLHADADPRTYPRRGYRKGQEGYWYGSSDVLAVLPYVLGLCCPEGISAARLRLRALCRLYRNLSGGPCACERQIAWALHHLSNAAQSRAA